MRRRFVARPLRRRGAGFARRTAWGALAAAAVAALLMNGYWYGGKPAPPWLAAGRERPVAGGFAARAVSAQTERLIATTMAAFVPQADELYVQNLRGGGVALFGTASLEGYNPGYAVCADVASRFLLAAYEDLPAVRVDFASIYIESRGRYIMAAALGRTAARRIAVAAFAPGGGAALVAELAKQNTDAGALASQAYAQYAPPPA